MSVNNSSQNQPISSKYQEWLTTEYEFWHDHKVKEPVPENGGPRHFPLSDYKQEEMDLMEYDFASPSDIPQATCGICRDFRPKSTFTCLPCGHRFYYKCLKKWLNDPHFNKLCPMCRRIGPEYACGHDIHGQIRAGNMITADSVKGKCYEACPGKFNINDINRWINQERQPPIQIVLWLAGEARHPPEVLEWARQSTNGINNIRLLKDNEEPNEEKFIVWFVEEIMEVAIKPIWPVWLVEAGNLRSLGFVRRNHRATQGLVRHFEHIYPARAGAYPGLKGREWIRRDIDKGNHIARGEILVGPLMNPSMWAVRRLHIVDLRREMVAYGEATNHKAADCAAEKLIKRAQQLGSVVMDQESNYLRRLAENESMAPRILDDEKTTGSNDTAALLPMLQSDIEQAEKDREACWKEYSSAFKKMLCLEKELDQHRGKYHPSRLMAPRNAYLDPIMTERALVFRETADDTLDKIIKEIDCWLDAIEEHYPKLLSMIRTN
ncbi:hypothetical protein TruAng_004950 [Truncatella angustata]|nr:hypothetical protein TruAng_004950 [Truncatella angustata]